jgi:predicted Zn finger-like uncharacterized protein
VPIRFQCEQCDTRIRVPDGAEGKRVRCPKCGNRQRVPGGKKKPPAVLDAADKSSETVDAPHSTHHHTPDEIELSSDPINRPSRSKRKRIKHYVPKALKAQTPSDSMPVDIGDAGADSSAEVEHVESKPSGESMADASVSSDDVADSAQQPDQPQPNDGNVPLLTLDEQPEGMMDSDDIEVPAAISNPDSIDKDDQPQRLTSDAFDQSNELADDQPVTEQSSDVQIKPVAPKAKAISLSKGLPADDDDGLDDSLGGSSLDDSSIDDVPDFDEQPIDPDEIDDSETIDDSGFFDTPDEAPDDAPEDVPVVAPDDAPGDQPQKQLAKVPKKPRPQPVTAAAAPPVPKPTVTSSKPPSFILLLLITWMMRTFGLVMLITACLLALTDIIALDNVSKNGRVMMIIACIGITLLFWGLAEAFAAIRVFACRSFRSR